MKYFGTDGVRGISNKELTPELAFRLGRTGGYVLTEHADSGEYQPQVLVAHDTRISGQMLAESLISGLLSVGIKVLRIGVITTPAVAYLVRNQGAAAGVMITASHNPVEDNGIKFFGSDGYKLSDDLEEEIETLLDKDDNLPRPTAQGIGMVEDYQDGIQKYIQFLEQTISDDLSGMHFTIDSANGATSGLVSRLYSDLGARFDTMATSPNGLNINEGIGSTHPEVIQKYTLEKGAQLGFAFDGDGDRCIAVDEIGNVINGDKIMYICGKYMSEHGLLKKNTIVTTVMSNLGLYKTMEKHGLKSVTTKVGDRYVVEEMISNDYNLGGEQSGHIVFLDFNTTGDGMLTSIQLLNIMKQTGKKLSELAEEVIDYPQGLRNIKVVDKKAVLNNQKVLSVINKIKNEMFGDGRVLVRPSGTEPLLRVMVEAPTKKSVDSYLNRIEEVIAKEVSVE